MHEKRIEDRGNNSRMVNLSLSSILLFTLVTPFIMTYRLSPAATPYWLFGLIFLGILSYTVLDILKMQKDTYVKLKYVLLWFLIATVLGSSFVSAIIVRHNSAPVYQIHDIVLQLEAATRFFLDGKNPYATSYFGTFLEEWHYSDTEVNPALYHFVMMPFYLLFSLPFYWVSVSLLGYWDGRMPLYFLFLVSLIMAFVLPKEGEKKLLFVTLLAFNPAMLGYTLEGRSDFFMFGFLIVSLYLLFKKRAVLASIPLALAFATKQSVWPLFPFYVGYLFLTEKSRANTIKCLVVFVCTFTLIVAPFYFWSSKEFVESTVLYLSGAVSHSYPISGYGFGMVLNQLGLIKDMKSYYPFIIWQMLIGIPLFVLLFRMLKKNPSVKKLILYYGVFLFVFWYFSRYFNNSHVAYLTVVFITAYFWPEGDIQKA